MPDATPWPKNIFANNEEELARAIGFRPEVLAFAKLMEANLRKHDGDRGSRGWINDDPDELFDRIGTYSMGDTTTEMAELATAIERWRVTDKLANVIDVAKEAADVANFAMMIADVVGGLKGE